MAPVTASRSRVYVGRDVNVVNESPNGVELEGAARLRPGRDVEIIFNDGGRARAGVTVKTAVVWTWALVGVGRNGPTFRGLCRWA
jgi:hypothetical protein